MQGYTIIRKFPLHYRKPPVTNITIPFKNLLSAIIPIIPHSIFYPLKWMKNLAIIFIVVKFTVFIKFFNLQAYGYLPVKDFFTHSSAAVRYIE
jgi:hypothetical protein